MRRGFFVAVVAPVAVLAALTACTASTSRLPPPQLNQGDPARGAQLIASYGCGSCHTVAGVPGADGLVGPPLTGIGSRMYIAGRLPTSAENLQRWIRDPQAIDPGNAMPNLGVTANDARDIAAYLLTTR